MLVAQRRRQNFSTKLYAGVPADALADLAIVAGNKLKNGAVKFSEFSRQMVEEFGEKVKPYLEKLYREKLTDLGLAKHIDEAGIRNAKLTQKLEDIEKPGRRNLDSHETQGGNTIERHVVGKTESWLRKRLESNPKLDFASSFRNKAVADRVQARFAKRYRAEIDEWLKSNEIRPLSIKFDMGEPVGIVVERGKSGYVETSKVRVVVVRDNSSHGWYFLTLFPEK